MEQPTEQATRKGGRRPRRWIGLLPGLGFILMVLLIGVLFQHIQARSELLKAQKAAGLKGQEETVNVVSLEMSPAQIRDRINLPGIVEPWVKLKLLTEVSGKVIKLLVKEGETVEQGCPIASLDSRDYENALRSANASYNLAVASLNRIRGLHREQLATRSQLDDVEAKVEMAQAVMNTAELNRERCTIMAPIASVINRLPAEKGQFLNVGDPAAEIIQIDRLKVRVGIPESDVDAIRNVVEFDVRIDALGGKVFRARKHHLSRTADSFARLYDLTLVLKNPTGEILPDMFARVEIVKKLVPDSLSVPLYAVISRGDEHVVYVVNDEHAHVRKVKLGLLEGFRIQITEGLKPGDRVIVVGHRNVNDGQPVQVVRKIQSIEELAR